MKKLAMFLTVAGLILAVSGVALADNILPPPWRGEDRTLTAVWDTWPDGVPNWWLDIQPDSWSSNPTLPTAPYVDLLDDAWMLNPWQGRDGLIVTYADWEVEFTIPNFSDNPFKDIWVQITYYPETDQMLAGFGVFADGMQGDSGEQFEGYVVHDDGWVTEAWSMRIWPNPSEENIALYFIDTAGANPYEYGVAIDQVVIDTRCIPEPATLSLLAIAGLAGLAAVVVRRRRTGR